MPAPDGQTPGSALIQPHSFWARGVKVSHISCGIDLVKPLGERQGAAYSTFGKALISLDKLGVPSYQARLSRNTPAPASAPTKVECFIHSGSSVGFGGDC